MNAKDTIAAATLMLEWAKAMEAGKPFELEVAKNNTGQWYKISIEPVWNWDTCLYRRKPEPKVVQLAMDDVPQNSWLKNNEDGTVMLVLRSDEKGVYVVTNIATICCLPFACLMGKMSIDRRDGKGWVACQKEGV